MSRTSSLTIIATILIMTLLAAASLGKKVEPSRRTGLVEPNVIENKTEGGRKVTANLEKCSPWKKLGAEGDESQRKCGKIGSWGLTWFDSDDRQTLRLEETGGKSFSVPFAKFLNYPEAFTPYFCSLDPRTEWRFDPKANRPTAVIAHVLWSTNEDNPQPRAEHDQVMVAKFTGSTPGCIVAVYDAKERKDAMEQARSFADDRLEDADCLTPKEQEK